MFGMILVDNQCDFEHVIWPLNETAWNGLSSADIIFPSFIFIMGMAIIFSVKPEEKKNPAVWYRIIKRSVLLIIIGMCLNLWARVPKIFEKGQPFHFRIPGIMQRLGLCYMITSLCYMNLPSVVGLITLLGGILAFYMGFAYGYKIPHCGDEHTSQTCNFGEYLDHKVFGTKFMHNPTDPEGLFTTLPALMNCFCGLFFMLIMRQKRNDQRQLLYYWGGFSACLLSVGYFLMIWIPICKKVWSLSFAFVSTGYSGLILTVCYYLIDLQKSDVIQKCIQPFVWLGRNPLFVFVGMDFLDIVLMDNIHVDKNTSLWQWIFANVFNSWIKQNYVSNLIMSLIMGLLWIFIAYQLFKRNIIIKL